MSRKRSVRTSSDPTTFFQISLRVSWRQMIEQVVTDGFADDSSEWIRGLIRRELRTLGYLQSPRQKEHLDDLHKQVELIVGKLLGTKALPAKPPGKSG